VWRRSASARAVARAITALFALAVVGGVFFLRPGCVRVAVWASVEKSDLLAEVAKDFEATRPSLDLRCVDIEVYRKASGDAEDALARGWRSSDGPRPDVWSPAANTWIALLDRHRSDTGRSAIVPSLRSSILQSPLVIAMPEPMAVTLGWPAKDIGWSDIFALAQSTQGWAAFAHPEWGRFRLAKTSPLSSTSGLHALLATYRFAPTRDVDDLRVREFVRGVEASVVHYGDIVLTFLKNLADADDRGEALSYVSAIAMEEKQVWDYNQGNPEFRSTPTLLPPNVKLVAIHPREGTFVADHPYVTLAEQWVDDQKQRAASLFLDYLRSETVQQRFLSSAFRGYGGEIGALLKNAKELDATKPITYFSLPEPSLLVRMQSSWKELRKRARVTIVIDTSSSMGEVAAGSATKLDLARQAALSALDQFAPDDELALWTFSGGSHSELVPLGRIVDQKALISTAIDKLTPEGPGKSLYATLTASVTALQRSFDRDRINAVVVLTDGRNDDPNDSEVSTLLRLLRAQREEERVRVFTIGYGARADFATLERIARASHGGSYDATDPRNIDRILLAVVSNF
jgi:Ca-activated chloride channel family protein